MEWEESMERIIEPADIEKPPATDYWLAALALRDCMENE